MAIVFNGKESIINIFDSSPYVDYYPILEDKECDFSLNKTKFANNSNLSPAAKLSIGPIQEVDITKMFQKIQLSLTNPNNSDIVSKSFIGLPEPKIVNESNQTCIIYGNPFSEQVSIKQKIKHKIKIKSQGAGPPCQGDAGRDGTGIFAVFCPETVA